MNLQSKLSQAELDEVQAQWNTLFQEFETAFNAGMDVHDASVMTLANKANALIQAFTGGDPAMEKSFQNMYSTEGGHNVLAQHGVKISAELFAFIANAMKEAKGK